MITLDRFLEFMNNELRRDPGYRGGMKFVNVGIGYDFVAPMLPISDERSLDKWVFDCVSTKYTVLAEKQNDWIITEQ